MLAEIAVIAAYTLISISAIPAILRMRKRQSSKDISLVWQSMIFIGVIIIFLYALSANSIWAMGGVFNIVSLASIYITALYYRRKND